MLPPPPHSEDGIVKYSVICPVISAKIITPRWLQFEDRKSLSEYQDNILKIADAWREKRVYLTIAR